ncbi:Cell division protein FtsX [Acaryochloris thomasi RCC1774]|uniref:Cell division protein FtsX n=1 Tax=Acaryochloris thomasi RCC1774 TaxID=1764569 RepID=A0A2W1JMZ6_9CYAN|nr:ABC transporter permease [Acaryochloris thomasi]PZD74659.1 Cell division protein FtsX [Acaryochloris thomasi RCC1774]
MFKLWLTKLGYLGQETLRGLRRGGWMNWAAISTVTVLLFLFGVSLQTSWQVSGLLNQMGSRLEISLYLESGVSGQVLRPTIEQYPEITAVEVVPKDQAWQELLQDLGQTDIDGATEDLGQNPLVDELKVSVRSAALVPPVAQKLAKVPGVDEVTYLDEALQNLIQINQGFSRLSVLVIGLLTLTAIAVITTTIRLIVISRHQEIEVMQLVGATRLWIYLPFILQGITFGVIGAIVSWGFLSATRRFMQHLLTEQPNFLQVVSDGVRLNSGQLILLPLILIGFGSLVGLVGSLFAVQRFALK